MGPGEVRAEKRKRKRQDSRLRLSWPKENDDRRAIVGKPPPNDATRPMRQCTFRPRFVHISTPDVEMHRRLIGTETTTTLPGLSIPSSWNPQKLQVGDEDLLQYFQHVAARALTTFGYDPTHLGGVLLRISFSNDTPSAKAVLRSLLAFSSLHRHGLQSQAGELKISALRALSTNESTDFDAAKAVCHVAAGMLLYSFEVQQSSCTSGDWIPYMCGVEKVVRTGQLNTLHSDEDVIAPLLDWAYYNHVIGRFSLRHWDNPGKGIRLLPALPTIAPEVSLASPSTVAILRLLSEAYGSGFENTACDKALGDQKECLKILDWRLRSVSTSGAVDEAFRRQQHIKKAFSLLSQLSSCERQFPVFILGCEARADEQRTIVLDLISRTEENSASRSFNHVKLLLEAIWAQDDLADAQIGELDYWNKLTSTVSRCSIPPCLA
ncbi:hypothetical protein NUW58_g6967 [Xylaria curta]|uniref:Uncharacterized protein n=1 Tax=Xylaria curta TaxID=42375 RepID=A0ACC1NPQ7_9PEZI|nr:hypothetical protein NUW58_g6967 [Xylaria curta]